MKSGKQRRAELTAKRNQRAAEAEAARDAEREQARQAELAAKQRAGVAVNPENLAPNNSYGQPEFVERGYYIDIDFTCCGCGKAETWTAAQQKWWYEVAQGYVYSTATHCRACRRRERERRDQARQVHQAGIARREQQRG